MDRAATVRTGGALTIAAYGAMVGRAVEAAELLDGVAKQYILDHYLQPCVFGVLVLLAIR